jgi:hypothetical protein
VKNMANFGTFEGGEPNSVNTVVTMAYREIGHFHQIFPGTSCKAVKNPAVAAVSGRPLRA